MATSTFCGSGLLRCICGAREAAPSAAPLAALPPRPKAEALSRIDDLSTDVPSAEGASQPTSPLNLAEDAAAPCRLLEVPWHDALAFFLKPSDLGRASQASAAMRQELTVEFTAHDGAAPTKRLLLAPVVEVRMDTAEAELRRVSIPHIHVLRAFQRLSFDAVAKVVRSSGQRGLRSLEKFICQDCPLHPADVSGFLAPTLASVQRLKLLNLEKNKIGDAFVQQLCRSGVIGRVETLNLRFNQVGDSGAQAIAGCPGARNLRWINLKMNRIGDEGCQALANLLKRSSTMTLLNLRRQGPGLSDRAAQALAEGLRASKSLEQLRLRKNRIGDTGATMLATAAVDRLRYMGKESGGLLELDLAENRVGDSGGVALLRAAKCAKSFTRVEFLLNSNPVTRDSLSLAVVNSGENLNPSDTRLCFEERKEGAF